jgi:hypothetical protein
MNKKGMILSGNMAVIGEKRNTCIDLVAKPERKTTFWTT